MYPEVIYCEGEKNGVLVEVAMQHNDAYNEVRTALSITSTHQREEPICLVLRRH